MIERYKAAIFDMDGTLLDSQPIWRTSGKHFLRDRGLPIPDEIVDDRRLTCRASCQVIARECDIGMDAEELYQYLLRNYLPRRYIDDVQPRPGAHDLVRAFQARGVPCCIATATPLYLARPAIRHHGFIGEVAFLIGGESLPVGKESPEFYRAVAHLMNCEPEECLVFEDALYAVRSAKGAGCVVCAVEDDFAEPWREEIRGLADWYVEGFGEVLMALQEKSGG